jgi:hypothetical protein
VQASHFRSRWGYGQGCQARPLHSRQANPVFYQGLLCDNWPEGTVRVADLFTDRDDITHNCHNADGMQIGIVIRE